MNSEGKARQSNLAAHGTKARISPVVSQLFRAIGSEMTEMVCIKVPDSKTGAMETRLVSKAEAMVRDLYEQAMPVSILDLDGMNSKTLILRGKGQMDARKLILAHTIDKNAKDPSGETVADKVSDLNKNRLNAIATGGKKETACGTKPKEKAKSKKLKVPCVVMRVRSETEVRGDLPSGESVS